MYIFHIIMSYRTYSAKKDQKEIESKLRNALKSTRYFSSKSFLRHKFIAT